MTASAPHPWRRRLVRGAGLFALLPLGLAVLGLAACQGRIIYPAQRYAPAMWDKLPASCEALRYETDEGKQVSFYQHPRSGGDPKRLWLVCSGNGGVALAWHDLLLTAPDAEAGFLLLDYPGYGFSEGSCTPGRILAASEAAVTALGERLGLPRAELDRRLGVFGHSLGAAAGLQYAARHPVRRVVLAAPFTTMVQMGHRQLFWPVGWLIWHRFDNEDRLAEIVARPDPPPVTIVHGDQDALIPSAMGRSLAEAHPGAVEFHLVPGADHDAVAVDAIRELGPSGPVPLGR
jgi:pimeloyl-ACP methyl ester carboxylesterase